MKNKDSIISTLVLFLIAAIWGSGFIASQMALDAQISPALLMAVRFSVASLIILSVFFKKLKAEFKKEYVKGGAIVGVVCFLAFYVQIVGLKYTTPANNAFLTATNVVMVPFIVWIISKKAPSTRIFFSSALCLLGIGFLSINLSSGFSLSLGDTLTLACALMFAFHIVFTGIYAHKIPTISLVFLQFATAAILSLLLFFITDRNFTGINTFEGISSLLYLGVFSTCVCYFLQTWVQKRVSSSKAAIILGTEALFGTLFSVILGYDTLTINMFIGGVIIMASLILTELSPQKEGEI